MPFIPLAINDFLQISLRCSCTVFDKKKHGFKKDRVMTESIVRGKSEYPTTFHSASFPSNTTGFIQPQCQIHLSRQMPPSGQHHPIPQQ
jgi:hypothetical protein